MSNIDRTQMDRDSDSAPVAGAAAGVRGRVQAPATEYVTVAAPHADAPRRATGDTDQTTAEKTPTGDYIGHCEACARMLFAAGRRQSYAASAVTAHGLAGETYLYCAPCWHGRDS
jgi:hypothetical protein